MDTCTLIMATTLLSIPCPQEQSCSQTIDGSKQICMSYCRPTPQSYDCKRPDGTTYIWTPKPGDGVVISTDTAR